MNRVRHRLVSASGTVNTSFELFDINPTPVDISGDYAPAVSLQGDCQSTTPGKFVIADNTSSTTYKNKWRRCAR